MSHMACGIDTRYADYALRDGLCGSGSSQLTAARSSISELDLGARILGRCRCSRMQGGIRALYNKFFYLYAHWHKKKHFRVLVGRCRCWALGDTRVARGLPPPCCPPPSLLAPSSLLSALSAVACGLLASNRSLLTAFGCRRFRLAFVFGLLWLCRGSRRNPKLACSDSALALHAHCKPT
jgi:hypothetical protein